jgi:tripartite ATP-independent transporter DctP family solute receptor
MYKSIRTLYSSFFLFLSALASAGLLTMSAAQAADLKERVIKFSFVQTLDSHWGLGAQRFADLVDKKSGGKLKIKLYPGGTLGGDQQTLSAMQGGIIEMSMMAPALLVGSVKEFSVLDLPFLFNDEKEADAVLDGPVGKKLMARLPDKGIIGLGYWEHGYRNLTNSRRPVARLEDMEGLKIRTLQVPLYLDMLQALGASAVPMPLPELYTALESKAVDGQENPNVTIETNKYYEAQKYLSTTRHVYNSIIVMSSRKMWDQLSAAERKILADAVDEAKPYQRQVSRDMDAKTLASLKAKGMTITEVSAQERSRMREKLKPVTDKYVKDAGESLAREMFAQLDRLRGTGGGR